ncbi:MAG: hypothetical protein PUC77_03695 [Bacteroidales bacterium]|nr:hypothetical protein [Bacteroidales bacterium]MDD6140361.1 hypothetical protein [Bacteroidales bacterium]MDD6622934.1 hypothetical protein [Bacteroidales bacterium]MDD6669219.1 hypothetical protein [Bacteroidales bacterium]
MIALFGMTMVSCSDDDDEPEIPGATGPHLEKVYWMATTSNGDVMDTFLYFDGNECFEGVYISTKSSLDWILEKSGKYVELYDLGVLDKHNCSIKKETKTTGSISIGNGTLSMTYELSADGNTLTLNDGSVRKLVNMASLDLKRGTVWNFTKESADW